MVSWLFCFQACGKVEASGWTCVAEGNSDHRSQTEERGNALEGKGRVDSPKTRALRSGPARSHSCLFHSSNSIGSRYNLIRA